jgi:hypothetical protein
VDSDSRIDSTNFSIEKSIEKMEKEKNIAFIQFKTRPLINSDKNFFSRQIATFTNNLFSIVFPIVTRGGEPAPLVGHNAIIRKTALIKASFEDENNNVCYWHENRVSEDFDFSLRSQQIGYIGVYGAYCCFEEGVSFTFQDELLKLSKFAYGSSEIIFSKSFLSYWACGDIPWYSKVNLSSYLFSYFAIASALIIAPLHLLLLCYVENWFGLTIDPLIILIFSFIVFTLLGPIASIRIMKGIDMRNNVEPPPKRFVEQMKLSLFMFIFYMGSCYSIMMGIFNHWVGIFSCCCRFNIGWGATKKSTEKKNIWIIIYNFRTHYIFILLFSGSVFCICYFKCYTWLGLIPSMMLVIGHILNPIILTPGKNREIE